MTQMLLLHFSLNVLTCGYMEMNRPNSNGLNMFINSKLYSIKEFNERETSEGKFIFSQELEKKKHTICKLNKEGLNRISKICYSTNVLNRMPNYLEGTNYPTGYKFIKVRQATKSEPNAWLDDATLGQYTMTKDTTISFSFQGIKIWLIGTFDSRQGNIGVKIDKGTETTISVGGARRTNQCSN